MMVLPYLGTLFQLPEVAEAGEVVLEEEVMEEVEEEVAVEVVVEVVVVVEDVEEVVVAVEDVEEEVVVEAHQLHTILRMIPLLVLMRMKKCPTAQAIASTIRLNLLLPHHNKPTQYFRLLPQVNSAVYQVYQSIQMSLSEWALNILQCGTVTLDMFTKIKQPCLK